jgi:hypothetical protein
VTVEEPLGPAVRTGEHQVDRDAAEQRRQARRRVATLEAHRHERVGWELGARQLLGRRVVHVAERAVRPLPQHPVLDDHRDHEVRDRHQIQRVQPQPPRRRSRPLAHHIVT